MRKSNNLLERSRRHSKSIVEDAPHYSGKPIIFPTKLEELVVDQKFHSYSLLVDGKVFLSGKVILLSNVSEADLMESQIWIDSKMIDRVGGPFVLEPEIHQNFGNGLYFHNQEVFDEQ